MEPREGYDGCSASPRSTDESVLTCGNSSDDLTCGNSSDDDSPASPRSTDVSVLSCGNSSDDSANHNTDSSEDTILPNSSSSSDPSDLSSSQEIDSSPSNSISSNFVGMFNHTAIYRPNDVIPPASVYIVENDHERYPAVEHNTQTTSFEDTDQGRLHLLKICSTIRSSFKKICRSRPACIPIIALFLVLLLAFGVASPFIFRSTEEATCLFLPNKVICPFEQEYSRIEILSPLKHLENGGGRISHELKDDTDITIQGFNIYVKNQKVIVRKQPTECPEEGDYPIKFTNGNVNSTKVKESKLSLKLKDLSDDIKMEITTFTNTSDNKDYLQIVCTGYLQCGRVVVDLELKITDFGTYDKPMNCSRTNTDGRVLDNYGYACTLFMGVDQFQRTNSLKCKPMVESLKNATAKYLYQQSVDVYNSTQSDFRLKKGQNATIMWNVNVPKLEDIRQLQTKLNGGLSPNDFAAGKRLRLLVRNKGYVANCEVRFRPVTCIDEGPWKLLLENGDIQHKQIHVDGLSTFTACPSQITVPAGGQLTLQFRSCIPDVFNKYSVDLYGRTNRSGSFQENKAIEISDQRTTFRSSLDLNELSVTSEMDQVTCADHMKDFDLTLGTTGETASKQFLSRAHVIGRYETFSTGGDFREMFPAVVNLRIHLGCRPLKLQITINGVLSLDTHNLTQDSNTGEKMFSKSFVYSKISMMEHGTTVSLHSSFIDDHGSARNISIEQIIHVVPESFCQEKPYGCNYRHPYNPNMMVACGEGIIAAFRKCQPGLVFFKSSCVGQCCPEGSATNCQLS